jgi:uncharacterized protein (DUF1800 family)
VTVDTTALIAHLYRRAGFGATAAELDAGTAAGFSATAAGLIGGLGGPDPAADAIPVPVLTPYPSDLAALAAVPGSRRALLRQLDAEYVQLVDWWLARMVATTNPLNEKLAFYWHGHFPTAISKVHLTEFMYRQNQVFRTYGQGDFRILTQQVAVDPAMLIWLDAASDKAEDPNENFARELLERFTMGIGTYSEADVLAAAVCFTGWRLNLRTGVFSISPLDHDPTRQSFLGVGGVNAGSQVIDIATGTPASSRFVPAAVWSHLAYPVSTDDPVVDDLVATYEPGRDVGALLTAVFEHPQFTSEAATAGLIKQPVEYVVGTLRQLGFGPDVVADPVLAVQTTLADLGQVLFDPPSVGGWPQNTGWLSTAAALTRWQFAHRVVSMADLSRIADAPKAARLDELADQLTVRQWSPTTASALKKVAGDPPTLTALALVSPEYVSN